MRPTGIGGVLGLRVTVGDQPALELARETAGGQILDAFDMPEQRAGAADLQGMIDLAKRVTVVERRCHQARLEAGQVVNEQTDAVGHQRRDPIPGLQTQAAVAAGQRGADPLELKPGHRPRDRHQRDVIRSGLEARSQQLVQRRAAADASGAPSSCIVRSYRRLLTLGARAHQTQPAGCCFHAHPQNSRPVHPSEAGFCSYVLRPVMFWRRLWDHVFPA